MFKKFLLIFTILLALLLAYSYLYPSNDEYKDEDTQEETINENKEKEEETLKFDKELPYEDAKYFEDVTVIDGQPMYYAYPKEIEVNNPPKLIVYSHGQLQRIIEDLDDEYMLKMREYGEFFASKGYVFSASNQHDDNWGQRESLEDIRKSIMWFEENNMPIKNELYMIGFSMGGRTAINYSIENPENISAIALLAPTQRLQLSQNDVEQIKEIPIKIWHGKEDVNIPFHSSQQYIQEFENYGKQIELIPIEGAGHYDIETSLMDKILDFFEGNY